MRLFSGLFVLSLILLLPAANAQTETVPSVQAVVDSAVWELHVNVERLFASPIGEMINTIIAKEAPDGKLNIDALVEAMGFDPRRDVREVIFFGDGFDETSVMAMANLGKSRGNLEGWMLAAPGYKSESLDDTTILHSFVLEKENSPRLWCALPFSKADNSYVAVAAFDRGKTVSLAQHLAQQGVGPLGKRLQDNTFLVLSVNDLSKAPIEIDEDEPGSAIVKTIQSLTLEVAAESENLAATCEITTDNPARAEQLNQLIVGMKAMMQLALPEKKPEAEELAKYLNNLNVEYTKGSPTLSANFAMDYDAIKELIEMKHKHD